MRRPELTPARSRSRRAHHADATRRRLIGGSRLSPAWSTAPGWRPEAITGPDVAEELRQLALELRWTTLPALKEHYRQEAALSGHAAPTGMSDADPLTLLHRDAQEIASVAPTLLTDADVEGMLAALSRARRREMAGITWGRRRSGKKASSDLLAKVPRERRVEVLDTARAVRGAWVTGVAPAPYGNATEVVGLLSAARGSLARLDSAVHGSGLSGLTFDQLEPALDALIGDARVPQMVRASELERELRSNGVAPVIDMLRSHFAQGKPLTASPSEVLRWISIRSVLEPAEVSNPSIAGVRGTELTAATETFQQMDSSHLNANASRIRRQAAVYLKRAFDNYPDQHSALKTEVTRKRNFRPVRRLFQDAPEVLLAAKPVWAMSPLQVSRILPAAQCFDVVIFDEASQVKPADAIPALMRGRQAIVAGDSRQLPPTEFFTKVLEDEEDDVEEAVELDSAETSDAQPQIARPRSSYTRDAESILFAMDRLLAGQSRSLEWHYRSYDERLIAVSNEHVYGGSLTTFPAPDTLESIRHDVVSYSPGISGGTNSPELEVRRVVELVKEQLTRHPEESIGIIAFGIKHEARIERAIEAAMQADPEFERALTANTDEPWFVKAIERVQGDERDAIILTVGYGKSADGRLRYFWGPLLQEGGDRRLNVAISRAKKRMTLVTSFAKDDVPADGHSSAGFRLMYNFVRFMASGGTDLTEGPSRGIPLNPFEIDIQRRLEEAGLHLDPQVGVGGYRIDFAARHPDHPGRHVLAIEADGASYHSGHIARERDRLRQQLLERRGWQFHRIWSTDWFNDADREAKRAVAAFDQAIQRTDQPAPPPAPQAAEALHWAEGSTVRKRPRPSFTRQPQITDYHMSTLIDIVRYVRSDDILRSAEDEQRLIMVELGLTRRGSRIQATIARAQELA